MATKKSLATITKTVKQLLASVQAANLEVAALICNAKEIHFEITNDWLAWAMEEFSIGRRHCFKLLCIHNYIAQVQKCGATAPRSKCRITALKKRISSLPLYKLEELVCIPIQELDKFLRHYDPFSLDRDQLREAVAGFLNRDRHRRFLPYGRLPDPAQLTLGLDDPATIKKIDFNTELQYIGAHMQRIAVVMDQVAPEQLVEMRSHLKDDIAIIESKIAGVK